MELFLDRLVIGLGQGAIYALLALALVLIYRSTGLLNFAQGEMALFSTYMTWQLIEWGLPLVVAVILSMILSFIGGALIERAIIRPVGDVEHNPLSIVIVTIGLFLAFNALVGWVWGTDGKIFPKALTTTLDLGVTTVSWQTVATLGVLVAELVVLYLVFQKTKLGLAMRAVASNSESSRLVGIRVGRMLMFGWGLAATVGALGGSLYASTLTTLDPSLMAVLLIYAFAAATLGGFDSPVGAVVGGLIVGVVTVMAEGYISWIGGDLKLAFAFVLILIVLMVRPQGLFGKEQVKRV